MYEKSDQGCMQMLQIEFSGSLCLYMKYLIYTFCHLFFFLCWVICSRLVWNFYIFFTFPLLKILSPCLRSCVCCLGTLSTFSQVQDAVRIFFAVFFWMSLFFWSCIWDGNNSGRPGKGPRIRRWDNRYLLHILCRVRNKGYLVPLISFVITWRKHNGLIVLFIHPHPFTTLSWSTMYIHVFCRKFDFQK